MSSLNLRLPDSVHRILTTKFTAVLFLLLVMSVRCVASGYRGDLADAWGHSSIVVLGHPQIVRTPDKDPLQAKHGLYLMNVQRAYKGAKTGDLIEFVDPFFRSSAELCIREGSNYVVFIQTSDDRKKCPHPATMNLGTALVGLRGLRVNDATLAEIEAGIMTIKKYAILPPQDRKAFLLQNLAITNAYAHAFIVREILDGGVREALPVFQQKLAQATNEVDRLNLIPPLRCLGDPSVKGILLAWLADDSFKQRVQIIEEMVRLKDASVIPSIRNYIDAKDDLLAVAARSALLRLEDPEGKRLCLEMAQKNIAPTARRNAIHCLNWDYSGSFTEDEMAIISRLAHDKDPSIARVASLIMEKWRSLSNQVPQGTARKLDDPQH